MNTVSQLKQITFFICILFTTSTLIQNITLAVGNDEHLIKAQEYTVSKNYECAVEEYEKAIQSGAVTRDVLKPKIVPLYVTLINTFILTGNSDKAIRYYEGSLAFDTLPPISEEVKIKLAKMYVDKTIFAYRDSQLDKSVNYYDRVNSLNTAQSSDIDRIVLAGDGEKAIKFYELLEPRTTLPVYVSMKLSSIYRSDAIEFNKRGKRENAIKYYEKACKLDKTLFTDKSFVSELSALYIGAGRVEDAKVILSPLYKENPGDERIRKLYEKTLTKLERYLLKVDESYEFAKEAVKESQRQWVNIKWKGEVVRIGDVSSALKTPEIRPVIRFWVKNLPTSFKRDNYIGESTDYDINCYTSFEILRKIQKGTVIMVLGRAEWYSGYPAPASVEAEYISIWQKNLNEWSSWIFVGRI